MSEITHGLVDYAGRLFSSSEHASAIDLAKGRGWIDENGDPTALGRVISTAFIDRQTSHGWRPDRTAA